MAQLHTKSTPRTKVFNIYEQMLINGTRVSIALKKNANPGLVKDSILRINDTRLQKSSERSHCLGQSAFPIGYIFAEDTSLDELPDLLSMDDAEKIAQAIDREEANRRALAVQQLARPSKEKKPSGKATRWLPTDFPVVEADSPVRAPERCDCGRKMTAKETRTKTIPTVVPTQLAIQKPNYHHMRCNGCGHQKWEKSLMLLWEDPTILWITPSRPPLSNTHIAYHCTG
ncbi:hypothetical protein [Pseudogemmobacter bohemicus]|uniref:hypothetical protein n=1 Tax=Pseudogemmobacter bohemicus TaxID=2250708 RepID=UPI001300AC35|nr:hypothetical protein [Pseudogemmobacter bohemicus]